MCQSKYVWYTTCRHTRKVPVRCPDVRLVRKLYRLVDGEEMDFVGVEPCHNWGIHAVEMAQSEVEESSDFCIPCKERRQILPIRVG